MTSEKNISADLIELAEFAEREDWLYQAELRLAEEFSRVAVAFAEVNREAEVICKDYIGADSVLRYHARSSLLRSIKSIKNPLINCRGLGLCTSSKRACQIALPRQILQRRSLSRKFNGVTCRCLGGSIGNARRGSGHWQLENRLSTFFAAIHYFAWRMALFERIDVGEVCGVDRKISVQLES